MLSDLNRVDFANVQVVNRAQTLSDARCAPVDRFASYVTGAGVVGVPVRRERGAASGAGLQSHPAAAEFSGPVGHLVGQRGLSGAQASPGQPQLPQGGPAVSAQMVLLQVNYITTTVVLKLNY